MSFYIENAYFDNKRNLKKIGYRDISGLIRVIKRVNKSCLKYETSTQLTIMLPIRPNKRKSNTLAPEGK